MIKTYSIELKIDRPGTEMDIVCSQADQEFTPENVKATADIVVNQFEQFEGLDEDTKLVVDLKTVSDVCGLSELSVNTTKGEFIHAVGVFNQAFSNQSSGSSASNVNA